MFRDHRHRADFEDAEERAERLLQSEHDGEIVGRLDLVDLHHVVARPRMSLFQHVQRKQHIGRGERLAVVPGHSRLQLEGVDLGIRTHGPAFRQAGQRLERRAVAQQAFEDIARDHLGRAVLDHCQHQAGRLGLDHDVDHAARLRFLSQCRQTCAAGHNQPEHDILQHDVPSPGLSLKHNDLARDAYSRALPESGKMRLRQKGSHVADVSRKRKLSTVRG